jgi:hypothetical protein
MGIDVALSIMTAGGRAFVDNDPGNRRGKIAISWVNLYTGLVRAGNDIQHYNAAKETGYVSQAFQS